jgi:DNA-binding GntR family transcriptional regulator
MAPSLAQKAYKFIKNDIIACVLEPGQQIVQTKLAEEYQIGTTPIRDALQRLAQEGLVEPIPRFGYIVSQITLSDLNDMYELRSIFESAAARLATVRASEEQLERIAKLARVTYVHRDREKTSEFLAINAEFHASIAIATGNQRLVNLFSKLLDEMTRLFQLGLDVRDNAEEMREEHITLVQALCDRDPDRAEQIAKGLVARSHERALEALKPSLEGSPLRPRRQAVHPKLSRS